MCGCTVSLVLVVLFATTDWLFTIFAGMLAQIHLIAGQYTKLHPLVEIGQVVAS